MRYFKSDRDVVEELTIADFHNIEYGFPHRIYRVTTCPGAANMLWTFALIPEQSLLHDRTKSRFVNGTPIDARFKIKGF